MACKKGSNMCAVRDRGEWKVVRKETLALERGLLRQLSWGGASSSHGKEMHRKKKEDLEEYEAVTSRRQGNKNEL